MNTIKIKFVVDGQDKEFEVIGIYPYLINPSQNKVVLRMTVAEADASYDDIYSLKTCTGVIEQYDRTVDGEEVGEWRKVNTYEGYNSGEIVIGYQNGQYSVDLTRVTEDKMKLDQLEAEVAELKARLAEMK